MTKVWFVTGSNSGIGAGIVHALVRIAGMAAPRTELAGYDAMVALARRLSLDAAEDLDDAVPAASDAALEAATEQVA